MPRKLVKNLETIDLVNNSVTVDLVNDNAKSSRKRSAKKNQKKGDDTLVLVVYYQDNSDSKQRLITLEGSLPYSDVPLMFKAIFSTEEILKDHIGYKLVNDDTEQRIKVSKVDDLKTIDGKQHIQYVIEVDCPTAKLQESNNFSKLFNSQKFSDVTLSVKDRVIYAHKNILANKSSVFETMFDQEMSNSQSNKLKIKDLDYKTACDFLYYIYAGKLRKDCTIDAFNRYSNLLVAADDYHVESLKKRCEEKLPLLLTTENVLDCLLLADLHNATNLKKAAIDLIVENAEEIISLPLYKRFLELHASLSVEVVRALLVKKRRTE